MTVIKTLFVALCVIAGLGLATCKAAIAQISSPTVLIFDDSDPDSPVSRHIREQIHSTLDDEVTQGYAKYTEFLNLGYFNASRYTASLRSYIKDKYGDTPVSLIVAIGTEALKFSLRVRAETWPQAPIVFVTFDSGVAGDFNPTNTTGIVVSRKFQDLLKAARLVVPKLARIALVGDSVARQPHRHQYREGLQQLTKELKVINLTGQPLAQVRARVTALPNDTAIVYLPLFSDASGMIQNPNEALAAIVNVANRPIVVDAENLIGSGATGGFVLSANNVGQELGGLAARVLNGESPSNIPIRVINFVKPVFDARQLKRWGIAQSALPVDSDFRFQEFSVWEQYRWQILTAVAIILIQCLVIGWLIIEHRQRQAAQVVAHERLLEVMDLRRTADASAMSASITHDLAQPLGAILSNAEAARALLAQESPDLHQVREIVEDIYNDDKLATEIISHLRGMLSPKVAKLEVFDLNGLIKNTLHRLRFETDKWGVNVTENYAKPIARVRADAIHIEQLILNLAMNAIDAMKKVARRDRNLELRTELVNESEIQVSVSDRGTGIPHDKLQQIFQAFYSTKAKGTGLGLAIARMIVESHSGKIWAANRADGGATFSFTLPLAASNPT